MNRKEYMDADKLTNGEYDARKGADIHAAYFSQFVNSHVTETVLRCIGRERLLASRDYHLNDIPLKLWDDLVMTGHIAAKAKEFGDNTSLSTKVCVYKQAARLWLAENSPKKVWPARYRYAGMPGDKQSYINAYAVGETADDALENLIAMNRGPGAHEITGEPVA